MKVLMLNGSPHEHGTTRRALDEMAAVLAEDGVEAEIMTIGNKQIPGCTACRRCKGHCVVYKDEVNEAIDKMKASDALVIASPVYFASPNGTLISFLDRMFIAGGGVETFSGKPAACVTVGRRAGMTASLDVLYKYPMVKGMPVITANYWTLVYGGNGAEAEQDGEGMEAIRTAARNMAWLMRCIELGRRGGAAFPPAEQPHHRTNFIR